MKLENVTAEVRPRGRWESIDFGCAMVRESYGVIIKVLLLTIVPLWALLWIGLREFSAVWLVLVYWLTLPLASRAVLYIVSRRLFGDSVSVWSVVAQWPKMIIRRFFHGVLLGRFSPSRSLALPVSELEGLRGSPYRSRVQLLERNGGDGAAQTAMIGWLLILVSALGLFLLIQAFVPVSMELLDFEDESLWEDDGGEIFWAWIAGLYACGALFIEPFCVGAGFAMYVNSRTITEGWDIELAFKRMSSRLGTLQQRSTSNAVKSVTVLCLSLICIGFLGSTSKVYAELGEDGVGSGELKVEPVVPLTESQRLASELYESSDFEIRSQIVDVPVEKPDHSNSWDTSFFGSLDFSGFSFLNGIFKALFYLIVIACIVAFVIVIYRNFHTFRLGKGRVKALDSPKSRVKSVMGMMVTKDSLPDDIVGAARSAWEEGEARLALSLLYRGALSWCADHTKVEFSDSDTESDCLNKMKIVSDEAKNDYFKVLTMTWVDLAYGEIIPENSTVNSLCSSWPFSENPGKSDSIRVGGGQV